MDKKPQARLLRAASCWLIVLFFAAGQTGADTNTPFSFGLLFQIEKPGMSPSFIFGTMHSEDPRVLLLPKPVKMHFNSADTLVLELDLAPATLLASMAGMLLQDGRKLHDIIGTQLYEQTVAAIAGRGMPEESIQKFKPWGVIMLLSMPPTKTGQFLDLILYQSAIREGKTIKGLETVEEQLAIFDTLPETSQIAILRDTLKNRGQFEQRFEELLTTYLKRQLGRLLQLSHKYAPADADTAQLLEERLVNNRNRLMAKRMEPLLKQGGNFIAIGALHLPGEKGVLSLLQQQGFQITVVY